VASIRLGALVGAAVLSTSVPAGCGESTSSDGSETAGTGPALAAPINLADCTDWQQASVEERLGTIGQIREFVGAPVPGTPGRGVALEDEEAYDLFENYCENEFARGFKLYKLYTRAAAFSSLVPEG
jgi:hypothetical protein